MATHPTLDLRFAPELRARLENFLASITDYEPTLVLMKGRRLPYSAERWDYGAYRPEHVELVRGELQRAGKRLLFIADGVVVAIPQSHLLHELKGRTLGVARNGSILVSDAAKA